MRRSGPALVLSILAAAALPATALAQGTPPPTPTPTPAPAKGAISLTLVRAQPGRVLVGDRVSVRGVVRPFVAGQQVVVRVYRGGKRLLALPAPVLPVAGGTAGVVQVAFEASRIGTLRVRASHIATPQQAAFRASELRFAVDPYRASFGSTGRVVRVLQSGLRRLGYVVGARGLYDARTARAVLAFRKVVGMPRTDVASDEVFRRLARAQGAFRVRFPKHGKHVEADLSRQVLALIRGGKVQRIYPTSSGAPATPTIRGTFHVYRKDPGTNAKGMVHSSYFIRGYAIHGYASVPVFNASHGCLRVPIPDSLSIFNWIALGDIVDVYA